MIKTSNIIKKLKGHRLGPYIEVPCSILAPLITGLSQDKECEVLNPVSEAVAMGIAAGSYLRKRKIPVILMQNSGLCNALNCLTSLNQIYHIPALFIVSWRGEPGTDDAPEHDIIGSKQEKILELLNVPYVLLSDKGYSREIANIVNLIKKSEKPGAIILREGLIAAEKAVRSKAVSPMPKSEAIDIIIDKSRGKASFVTTSGFISREVFHNLTSKKIEDNNPPFYMIGSMGHALPIGLGMAMHDTNGKKIIVLDGDGGCLMHLGAMASVGKDKPKALIHIVLDNGAYASTGGQPTISRHIDFCKIAKGCGYREVYHVARKPMLKNVLSKLFNAPGPMFLHILINDIEAKDRPRISKQYSCQDIKKRFMGSWRQ